jgi:hypothetical protein
MMGSRDRGADAAGVVNWSGAIGTVSGGTEIEGRIVDSMELVTKAAEGLND